jgi:hypothetical protein
VRWLSRGKVLKRLVELKEEERRFLQGSSSPLYQHFLDKKWLALLSAMAEIQSKYRNQLQLKSDLRVAVSTI